jgi:hypothetical protein
MGPIERRHFGGIAKVQYTMTVVGEQYRVVAHLCPGMSNRREHDSHAMNMSVTIRVRRQSPHYGLFASEFPGVSGAPGGRDLLELRDAKVPPQCSLDQFKEAGALCGANLSKLTF